MLPPGYWAAQSFQSTPVIANGRIGTAEGRADKSGRFNPRPLLLTGESLGGHGQAVEKLAVSIHARYC